MTEPEVDTAPANSFIPLPQSVKPTIGQRLRAYFFTGVVVAGPLAITVYITWSFINLIDAWFTPLIPTGYLPESFVHVNIPGIGLLIAFVSLTLLGFLTANLVGRWLLAFGETLLGRMPVIRGLYKGVKQVFETIFSQSGTSFRTVPGSDEYVSCFLPCTPNPTTGFFLYIKRKDVIEVAISIDEAAKLIMSAGLIQPKDSKLVLSGQPKVADGHTAKIGA